MEFVENFNNKNKDDYVFIRRGKYPYKVKEETEAFLKIFCCNSEVYRNKKDGSYLMKLKPEHGEHIQVWKNDILEGDFHSKARDHYNHNQSSQRIILINKNNNEFSLSDLKQWCQDKGIDLRN